MARRQHDDAPAPQSSSPAPTTTPTPTPHTPRPDDDAQASEHGTYSLSSRDREALNRQYPHASSSSHSHRPDLARAAAQTPDRPSDDESLRRSTITQSPVDSVSPIADLGQNDRPRASARHSYMAGVGGGSRRPSLRMQALETNQYAQPKGRLRAASSVTTEVKQFIKNARREDKRKKLGGGTWKDRVKDRLAYWHKKIVLEAILRQYPLPPTKDGRHVPLNPGAAEVGSHGLIDERSGKAFVSNFIRSSRYTIWDFLPKQLIFQFSKLGHFYFLVIGILQLIPGLSTIGRYTTIVPLAIFVCLSMAKEGYDDYRRYLLDKSENRSYASVLRHGARSQYEEHSKQVAARKRRREKAAASGEDPHLDDENDPDWMSLLWQDVRVGDVVRLRRDQGIPADMALLSATGPNGIAYVDTMALDGETNLKSKQASPLFAERCNTLEGLKSTRAMVISEDPNIDLYSYDGRATVEGETLPLTLNNILYRGSTLRNTKEAIGLVINSGEECKIRMNANRNITTKKPAMQSNINKMVLIQIVVVIMLAGGLTIGYYIWNKKEHDSWYLFQPGLFSTRVPFREIFIGYVIMFNTLIPLSLYISLEIIKLGQLFLLYDVDMYDPITDTPMVANTTTILENLGQVGYLFSDKTGTLTENVMRFRKMSVAGMAYLHDMDVRRDEEAKRKKIEESHRRKKGKSKADMRTGSEITTMGATSSKINTGTLEGLESERPARPSRAPSTWSLSNWWTQKPMTDGPPEMKTEHLLDFLQRQPDTVFSRKAKHFLLCIALCHTCLPEIKDDGETSYQAASPDELALVDAAKDMGMLLIDRATNMITLQFHNPDGTTYNESYQVLDVIEFTSKRKRMSIIVRMPDNRLCIICKGADNVITSRLRLSQLAEQKASEVARQANTRKIGEQDREFLRRSSVQSPGLYASPRNSFGFSRRSSTKGPEGLRYSLGRRSTDLGRRMSAQLSQWASWGNKQDLEGQGTPKASTDMLQSPRTPIDGMHSQDQHDAQVDESVASSDAATFERCFRHVEEFASDGLRTLMYAYRYLDDATYYKWKETYREAEQSLVDRQDRVEEAADLIEHKFELAGATAIEDKLQEGVPETIDKLRRANIKVWMLTGDKRETAINIGHSARVCKPCSEVFILDYTVGDLQEKMTATLKTVGRGMTPHSVLVVDGGTLAKIDAEDDLAILFYDLVVMVDSVICCRASPSQKANLVKSIRRYVPKVMTCAIGDGANDIGMIQASHVGIGISGREGLQAARISDYSIAQFRFLQKLLFVHGRWHYLRTGKYVLATFWKEILFFLVQAHYQRFNGYTGTSMFESWSLTVFNSAFTSLPVILLGIFEKDLQQDTLMALPELYTFGQEGRGFNFTQYFGWAIQGVVGSFIIFYFMKIPYENALYDDDTSLYAMGVACFTVAVIFINIKLLILETHSKTLIMFGGVIISVAGWFFWNLVISKIYERKIGVFIVHDAIIENFGRTLIWWTIVLLELAALIVLELVIQAVRRVYWPTDEDLMQRLEKDEKAYRALMERAKEADAGEGEGFEMQDLIPVMDGKGEQGKRRFGFRRKGKEEGADGEG
ncbi:hypothetical protein NLU13_9671 [Sarocladium strictum]|uniref:Phospholipid-transporting ATPase n=1 Tax=Sarocladium strictum TaxID=5046 RepID=A0AA39GAK0_SARSR|nr:hypothetical protein NLU13_9671 [Sarocladium strictum]